MEEEFIEDSESGEILTQDHEEIVVESISEEDGRLKQEVMYLEEGNYEDNNEVYEEEIMEEELYDDEGILYSEEQSQEDYIEEEVIEDEYIEESEQSVDQASSSNDDLVILKSEGSESIVTYSINTNAEADSEVSKDADYQTIIIHDEEGLNHQNFEIIDGFLVPTTQIEPRLPYPAVEDLRPANPATLTPEALRTRARSQPNKLLIIYHCSYCQDAFEDFPSIKVHEQQHVSAGDRILTNKNPQTEYLGTSLIPQSESKYVCGYCFKKFDVGVEHKQHIKKVHEKKKKRKKSGSPEELQQKLIPAIDPIKNVTYSCSLCAETFSSYAQYVDHLTDVHSTLTDTKSMS